MSLSRLGMILQQQGYQSKRVGKACTRGWIVYEKDADEVQNNRHIKKYVFIYPLFYYFI